MIYDWLALFFFEKENRMLECLARWLKREHPVCGTTAKKSSQFPASSSIGFPQLTS